MRFHLRSPVEDVRFHLRRNIAPYFREHYEALLARLEAAGGKASAASKREYLRLWQLERETLERGERAKRHAVHARLRRMQTRKAA